MKNVQVMLLISKNPKQPPENGPGKKKTVNHGISTTKLQLAGDRQDFFQGPSSGRFSNLDFVASDI